jgi:alpha-D-xyloside xylohydrolase
MYGFGLQLLSFEQRSKKRTIRVNADPRVDSGDSHAPVPFYVTTLGYGVLVDTLRHAEFYCGEAHPKPTLAVNAKSVTVNTPQESRDRDQGVASRVLVEVPRVRAWTCIYSAARRCWKQCSVITYLPEEVLFLRVGAWLLVQAGYVS